MDCGRNKYHELQYNVYTCILHNKILDLVHNYSILSGGGRLSRSPGLRPCLGAPGGPARTNARWKAEIRQLLQGETLSKGTAFKE